MESQFMYSFFLYYFTHIIRNYFGLGPISLEGPNTPGKGYETTTTGSGIRQYYEQHEAMIFRERTVGKRPHLCSNTRMPLPLWASRAYSWQKRKK